MPEPKPSTCAIVGIGASAGGLAALRELLGALPVSPPFAIVVVQHLNPATRSQLAEIIDRSCQLDVVRAKGGDVPVAGTVYVVPEGRVAVMTDGKLRLKQRSGATCNEPIDAFFTSLAEHNEANGCGVILSGNGSDGVLGLRRIRGAGGITLAQDPSTAEFPGMPASAIDAGVCDFVGTPESLAHDLMAHVGKPEPKIPRRTSAEAKTLAEDEAKVLGKILGLVRLDSGMDFSGYKPTTINRRVRRRAMLADAQGLQEYFAHLERDPSEVTALADDLLINVTEFFRDQDVFEALRSVTFPEILKSKTDADTLRIWVVGCSTGEEVYSLLITALEAMEQTGASPKVTIFGTDASEWAVTRARAGIYPSSICASVSPERLTKYFVRTEAGFEIDRALREMCVFARQDITRDTPFSRQDMVSLRNVLIYMDQPLQRQVLSVAHFALAPEGLLLLGTSETTETESRLFKLFDKRHHIYRRQNVASKLPVDIANATRTSIDALSASASVLSFEADVPDAHAAANDLALLLYAPPRVVVDANGHILHFFGDTTPFLKHAVGRATLDVAEMAHPGIALELKDAIEAARTTDGRATRDVNFTSNGQKRHVSLEAMPLPSPPGQTQLMVAFREYSSAEAALASPVTNEDLARLYEAREQRVRAELAAMRGRLRVVADERAQTDQSLRSANEEIRSSNEELQSINEELETAKEELQSANEELITVNDELRQSNRDLSVVNDDLLNFASSINVPALIVDRALRVRRFTPQACRVVRIEQSDVGRLLAHLRLRVDVGDLTGLAASVIDTAEPLQLETTDEDGCWYLLTVRPYQSAEGGIDGAVIAFSDVDELKRGAEALEKRARLGEALTAIDANLASTMDFNEIMQCALDDGVRTLGAEAGTIEVRDGDDWVVRNQNGFTTADVGLRLSEAEAPNATEAARLGEPVMIADMARDQKRYVGFVKSHALKSVLAVPLIVRGAAMGTLLFYNRRHAAAFTADEIEFGRRLGASVSLALENSRLLHAEQHAKKRAETLNAINEIIRSAITPDDLLARLVGEVSEVAGADMSLVIEVRGDEYVVTHVRNVRDDLVGAPRTAEFYPGFALAAKAGEPVLIGDTWEDPRTNKEFVVPHGLRAFQLLPLVVDQAAVAVLALAFGQPREFDEEDAAFSDRVCTAMSMALRNALLYQSEVHSREEAKSELEFSELLLAASRMLTGAGDLQSRLTELAELVSSALAHDRVVMSTWDAQAREVTVVSTSGGPPPAATRTPWEGMSAPAREALEGRRPVVVDYEKQPKSIRRLSNKAGFKLAVLVPMVLAGDAVGLIVADQPGEARRFTEREIELLKAIAAQAGAAVEADRLLAAEIAAQQRASSELGTTTALLEAASEIGRWTDLADVVRGLGETVLKSSSHSRVIVSMWDEDSRELVVVGSHGERPLDVGGRWAIDSVSAAARAAVFDRKTAVWDLDAIAEEVRGVALEKLDMHLGIYVPLVQRDSVVGLLIVDNPGERREFSEREIDLIESIAAQAAVALENARLFVAEQVELARTTLLRDVAAAAASSVDVRELSERTLAACCDGLGARAGSIYVIDPGAGSLTATALFGFPPKLMRQMEHMELDEDRAAARSFLRNEVVSHDSPDLPTAIAKRAKAAKATESRWVSVPIRIRGEAVGSLGLVFPEQRAFTADEIALCQVLADQLGVGVDKARLFEAEVEAQQRANRELETTTALLEAAADVAQWTNIDEVVRGLAQSVLKSTSRSRAIVDLWHEDRRAFQIVASEGEVPLPLGGFWSADSTSDASREAIFQRRTIVVDYDAMPAEERGVAADVFHARLALYVPLVHRGNVVGLLIVDDPGERREFGEREISLIQGIASQAAVAVENARLFEAAQRSKRRVEALQKIAELSASSLELVEIVDKAAAFMSERLGVDVVTFWRLDRERRVLFPVTGVGFPLEFFDGFSGGVGLDQPFEIARAVAESRAVVRSAGDIGLVPEPVRASYAKFGVPLGALLVLPVRSGLRALGAITLAWQEPREISDDDVAFFMSAADEIAVGAENAMLFESEKRELSRTQMLQAVATAAAKSLSIHEICELALEEVRRLPDVAATALYELDAERRVLRNIGVFGYPDDMQVWLSELPIDDSSNPGRVAAHNLAMLTHDDPGNPPEASKRLAHMGVPSARWIALPMRSAGTLVGVIGLIFHGERPFEPQEVALFSAIADTLAVALANAQLYQSEVAAQQAAQEELTRTTLLKEIAAIGAGTLDPRDLAVRALAATRRLLGAKTGNLFVLDGESSVLRSLASFGVPKKALAAFDVVPLDSDTTTARVALTGEIETHAGRDTTETSARVAKLTGKPSVGWVALPVRSRGAVIGTLGLSFEDDRPFEADEIGLYRSLADQIGVGLERARLFSDLEVSREQVSSILRSISDGFYALDRDWRFTYANAEAGRMIGVPHAELIGKTIAQALGDEVFEFQRKAFAPAMNDGQIVEFERFFAQTGIWAEIRVYPSAEGVAVYGRDITERKVAEEALRDSRERAEMMANLLDESAQPFAVGNLDGSVGLANSAFERLTGYSAEELAQVSWANTLTPPEYVQMEAEKLAELRATGQPVRYEKEYIRKDGSRVPIALLVHIDMGEDGAPRHYSAFITDLTERKEYERLDAAFNEIRTAIGGTLEYSAMVRAALTMGADALGADSGAVFKNERRGWCVVDSVGLPQSMTEGVQRDVDTLVGPLVTAAGGAIVINDPARDGRLDKATVRRQRVKALLAAPLGIKSAELGVLAFYHRKKIEPFTEAQRSFVTRLARVVAIAIQNSMLYERERVIADTLQEALLLPPETIRGIETSYLYRAASSTANVGGDFYDVFSIAEDKCVIVVGDVSGKGLTAARLTSLIHDGIRAYALETSNAEEILTRLNHLVCHLSPPEQFATLFFGILNTESGLMRYCTAGHPPAMVIDAGHASYLLSTNSPVLGAFARAPFHCFDTVLALGDRLVLYTDGVTEARRGTEFLGEEGLLKLADKVVRTPAQRLPQRLLDKVLAFAEGHLRDDTVILCVERTEGAKSHGPGAPAGTADAT